MKTKLLFIIGVPFALIVLISGTLYHEGSPGGRTGSPIDGGTCAQCHNSTVEEVQWFSSNIPEEGWIPGETYKITLTAESETASIVGFEVTAESVEKKAGVFSVVDSDKTKLIKNNQAVTHTNMGTTPTDGIASWEMNWTAPKEDVGDISFYAAINAANGNESTSGDQIYTSSIGFLQAQTSSLNSLADVKLKMFPNPTSNYVFIQSPEEIQHILIYGINGNKVKEFRNINSINTKLDLSDIAKGMNLVRIKTTDGEIDRKIQLR